VLAGVAGVLILGAYLLGRDKARKRDEKTRNQAMIDALDALNKLITGVNNDQIDGATALQQAASIRENYVTNMGQLKDKKTRGIALKDVSRLDALIGQLNTAVTNQVSRQQRQDLLVPTFAEGGPVGYQDGFGSGTSDNYMAFFPGAGRSAMYSPTEYILDAETTRNIGVRNLNTMLSSKGRSFQEMRNQMVRPRFATGGGVGSFPTAEAAASSATQGGPPVINITLQVGLAEEEFVKVIAATMKSNNGSQEQINAIVKSLTNSGQDSTVAQLAELLKPRITGK
jgi:hypothetical protein